MHRLAASTVREHLVASLAALVAFLVAFIATEVDAGIGDVLLAAIIAWVCTVLVSALVGRLPLAHIVTVTTKATLFGAAAAAFLLWAAGRSLASLAGWSV